MLGGGNLPDGLTYQRRSRGAGTRPRKVILSRYEHVRLHPGVKGHRTQTENDGKEKPTLRVDARQPVEPGPLEPGNFRQRQWHAASEGLWY